MNLNVIQFCAEEVERQRRGPIQVWWMCEAWDYAGGAADDLPYGRLPSLIQIQRLGKLVEHDANTGTSWRSCNVRVGLHVAPQYREVPDLMSRWCANLDAMTPAEAYKEFELIHPFQDGNGRVGKIIYNWLKGTLDDPVMPPNFFGGTP